MLVPNNTIGCLLGKRGDVIQRLRKETHANIRILAPDQLPVCGLKTDELLQISGKPDIVKRAIYEVSRLLHENPRPSGFPIPFGHQGFRAMTNLPPPVVASCFISLYLSLLDSHNYKTPVIKEGNSVTNFQKPLILQKHTTEYYAPLEKSVPNSHYQ
ncbi:hypothetical protein LXL04_024513 [Taraxacum kok-saghyz]